LTPEVLIRVDRLRRLVGRRDGRRLGWIAGGARIRHNGLHRGVRHNRRRSFDWFGWNLERFIPIVLQKLKAGACAFEHRQVDHP
jgi:hypothetical protein